MARRFEARIHLQDAQFTRTFTLYFAVSILMLDLVPEPRTSQFSNPNKYNWTCRWGLAAVISCRI